jgi:hypothetical protein
VPPIKIMTWNIMSFSDTFWPGMGAVTPDTASTYGEMAGLQIIDAIKTVDPDIVVIQEARATAGAVASLATDGAGVRALLAVLNRLGAGWCALPPLRLNPQSTSTYSTISGHPYTEASCILFQTRNLDFIGPDVWDGNSPVSRADGPTPTAYGGGWSAVLPATPPAAVGYMGCNQNQLAPRLQFYNVDTDARTIQEVCLPAPSFRRAVYAAFWDKANNQVIKLLCVHLPPPNSTVKGPNLQAMEKLGLMEFLGWWAPIDGTDTQGKAIILGDFNVNAVNPTDEAYFTQYFSNYTRFIRTTNTMATMMEDAIPRSSSPYLYQNTNWWRTDSGGYLLAADNILVGGYTSPNPPQPAAATFQLLDWVLLTPGTGGGTNQAYMSDGRGWITSDGTFCALKNYAKIRTASDHIGLLVTI